MNLQISLAFLSYYRYSFFCMDFIIFLMGMLVYRHITSTILPSLLPEEKQPRYVWIRNITYFLIMLQLICFLVLFVSILPHKPIFIHEKASIGIYGFFFVLMVVLRFVLIIMTTALLFICWFMTKKEKKLLLRWYIVIGLFLVYFTYMTFYILFPSLNKALLIYELFYNIRNLYITKDKQKTEKTILYLEKFKCIPNKYTSLYHEEWKRTFKNYKSPILSCSFS